MYLDPQPQVDWSQWWNLSDEPYRLPASIAAAVAALQHYPCQACPYHDTCATAATACSAWHRWTATGKPQTELGEDIEAL